MALQFGLIYDFRNPERWRRPPAELYAEQLEQITYAEQLGFDSVWITEHHFIEDGYTPSVFRLLATTVERLGNATVGGITALLTVLVDGDDFEEPISDAVRSLVDGHIILDRRIAEARWRSRIDRPRVGCRPDLAAVITDNA